MATIAIVGDGPGGLSAALFLAKNGHRAVVYGDDATSMHHALLKNYLGMPEVPGSDFQAAAIEQVETAGADVRRIRVISVMPDDDRFEISAEDGSILDADYVVLSEGRSATLAEALGLATEAGAIITDMHARTSTPRIYAVGRSVRPARSQAIISAGAGAIAALDILSDISGDDVQDWDSLPKD